MTSRPDSRPDPRPDFRHDRTGTPAAAWEDAVAAAPPLRLVDTAGEPVTRVVVVAAHPDDEVLGAGGLLAMVGRAGGVRAEVVVLTDGEGSHPRSPTHGPEALARRRAEECRAGLAALGDVGLLRCGLPDGDVAGHEDAAVAAVVDVVGDGRGVLVVAPWRGDGHPDHEAAGRAAATATVRTGARLVEYPVWWWHWADPAGAGPALATASALALDDAARGTKAAAIACHRSQVADLSDHPGDERLLGPDLLAHFARPVEVFLEQAAVDEALEDLHAGGAEPWAADSRWYEERKRALLLAVLPDRHHGRALDVGCSTGVTTLALAERCDEVVAVDASASAVRSARLRLAGAPDVHVEALRVPAEWPEGEFDLVVVSEVGYFLTPAGLELLVDRVAGSVAGSGVVVLADWRHPVSGWPLDGSDVHAAFLARSGLERLATYVDRDVEILMLGPPGRLPEPTT